ncbi:TetR/AcrR family transcriptional regulator [Glycomyces harbinensis]|uniref:Transcriptional regulator, TetR family n=1 Tax=Glycomyces harbinensis TaxID=58114 RepID=A0A1G7ABV2_9ACTN|nr:TetR/AcrR family transcriptional regulator [Glycomyces harbinensis]SDE11346.1 transcriptional regulator, TetR family [Glycomyces harbinensis]
MAASKAPSRERIVAGAADLISRRGLNAASIRELAKHADAPLGSTYHYFPQGKRQVATEAVQYAGEAVARLLQRELAAGPVAGLRAFLGLWRGVVVKTGYRAGCPVLAVAVEEPADEAAPPELLAAATVFEDWERLLAESLRGHGAEPDEAVELAALIVAAVEGAVAMCRAKRSITPLDRVARRLEAAITDALPSDQASPGSTALIPWVP